MKNSYSHFYLYAKGHYERTNLIEDMKKLISHRSGIDVEHVEKRDIAIVLTDIVYKHIKNEYQFSKFVSDTVVGNFFIKKDDPIERFIDACLSVLTFVGVKDDMGNTILELDEPDYSILPPNEKIIKKENKKL